jgi:hypothetical protein
MPSNYDGNMLAGPLSEVFVADVTTALVRCAGCGRSEALARVDVYGPEPGWVARCPGCAAVLLRLAEDSRTRWLDLSGIAVLRFAIATPVEAEGGS